MEWHWSMRYNHTYLEGCPGNVMGKVYRTVVMPAIIYGDETFACLKEGGDDITCT